MTLILKSIVKFLLGLRRIHGSSDFVTMDTTQVNVRMSREMLDAIMSVSGGKSRRSVPVYIRQAIALMLKIDGAKVDPAWVELVQGKRNDMKTPEGRSRAEKQLAAARAAKKRRARSE